MATGTTKSKVTSYELEIGLLLLTKLICLHRCIKTVVDVVSAFRSAVHSVTEEKEGATRFIVKGSAGMHYLIIILY